MGTILDGLSSSVPIESSAIFHVELEMMRLQPKDRIMEINSKGVFID